MSIEEKTLPEQLFLSTSFEMLQDVSNELNYSVEQVNDFSPGEKVPSKLENIYNGVVKFVNELFGKQEDNNLTDQFGSELDFSKLKMFAERYSTSDMAGIKVLIPNGLSVDFVIYVSSLITIQEKLSKTEQELIKPFSIYLGKAFNNPVLLTSLSFSPDGYRKLDYDDLKKNLFNMFKDNSKTETKQWKQVFRRQADVKVVLEQLEKLIRNDKERPLNQLKQSVNDLNDIGSKIIDKINDPNTDYILNAKSAKHLNEMMMDIAKRTELIVVIHEMIYELARCLMNTQETLLLSKS